MTQKSDEMEIESIISKLPEEVQTFANKNIEFNWIRNVGAITLPTKEYKPIIIVYTETIPEYIIAHEIAHAWLRHRKFGSSEEEEEAHRQAKEWGFEKDFDDTMTSLEYLLSLEKDDKKLIKCSCGNYIIKKKQRCVFCGKVIE